MYHVAILYPTRALLADALRRLLAAGIELDGAADHGVFPLGGLAGGAGEPGAGDAGAG